MGLDMYSICLYFLAFIAIFVTTASSQDLEIVNIRVGQGDSTLILGPANSTGERVVVLFDAGDISNSDFDGGDILRAVLNKRKIKEVDFVILSHDDADHIGGLAFDGFHGASFMLGFNNVPGDEGDDDGNGTVDWLSTNPVFVPDPDELGLDDDVRVKTFIDYGDALMRDTIAIRKYQAFANTVGNRITINSQDQVDTFEIDLGNGARMICYAANGFVRGRSTRVANVNTPNERSLSFLVTYGEFDFLISGDLIGRASGTENAKVEEAVGQSIINDGRSVEVLHVNHHGANNASSTEFLNLIKPHIAIISAGNENDHKHPVNAALQRLADAGVYRIIQTAWGTTKDKIPLDVRDNHAIWQQDIVVRTNGENYWLETSRSFKADN